MSAAVQNTLLVRRRVVTLYTLSSFGYLWVTGHVPLFANPLFAKNWQRTVVCQLFLEKIFFWQETVVCQLFFAGKMSSYFWHEIRLWILFPDQKYFATLLSSSPSSCFSDHRSDERIRTKFLNIISLRIQF